MCLCVITHVSEILIKKMKNRNKNLRKTVKVESNRLKTLVLIFNLAQS